MVFIILNIKTYFISFVVTFKFLSEVAYFFLIESGSRKCKKQNCMLEGKSLVSHYLLIQGQCRTRKNEN